jgi:hypothetical protein
MRGMATLNHENYKRLGLGSRSPFRLRLKEISFDGDDAGIEAGSSHKKSRRPDHGKLEYPVSIDKPRYELQQR